LVGEEGELVQLKQAGRGWGRGEGGCGIPGFWTKNLINVFLKAPTKFFPPIFVFYFHTLL